MPDLERYRQLVEEGAILDRNTILNLITQAQQTETAKRELRNERVVSMAAAVLFHNVRELHDEWQGYCIECEHKHPCDTLKALDGETDA